MVFNAYRSLLQVHVDGNSYFLLPYQPTEHIARKFTREFSGTSVMAAKAYNILFWQHFKQAKICVTHDVWKYSIIAEACFKSKQSSPPGLSQFGWLIPANISFISERLSSKHMCLSKTESQLHDTLLCNFSHQKVEVGKNKRCLTTFKVIGQRIIDITLPYLFSGTD